MEFLKMQLSNTFQSMKQEGLVDDQFMLVYSLKSSVQDHFYLELIPEFCCNVRYDLELLSQAMNDENLNYELMKDYVYKVKGSSATFGACGIAEAFANFARAIDAASKEECLKAMERVQREVSAIEEKLHDCLQLETKMVSLAEQEANM